MHTQIIAIGGGAMSREQEDFPIERYILEQTGKPEPKVCFIPTASGDAERPTLRFYSVFNRCKCQRTVLSHQHFILYKGTEIVGYAHIQLFSKRQALIRIIVITDEMRKHGFGKEFLQFIEKWLKEYGYSSIHAESTLEALPYYKKMGYTNMPFPDTSEEDQHSTDIAVGKQLLSKNN